MSVCISIRRLKISDERRHKQEKLDYLSICDYAVMVRYFELIDAIESMLFFD